MKRPGKPDQPTSMHSRHHDILEDPDVNRWYRGMQARSRASASVYRNHLARFCKAVGVSPARYAALPEKEQADLLQDFIFAESEEKRLSGKYLEKYVTAIQTWLRHNGKLLVRPVSVPHHAGQGRKIRVPDQGELARIRTGLDPHNCIRLDILALSGQRPEVMGMHGGRDGLRLGDIEDLVIDGDEIEWRNMPARVVVRSEISKNRKPYFFFLAKTTCALITADLRMRLRRGEQLGPDSPLVVSRFRRHARHIHTGNITKPLRQAMDRQGIESPVYAWRSYFSHFWMVHGGDFDLGEFYMGHGGGIASVYRLRKELPPDSIEAMRASYAEMAAKLLGEGTGGRMSPYAEVAAAMLRLSGIPDEQVEQLKLADLSSEEVVELMRQHMDPSQAQVARPQEGPRQRIIPGDGVGTALEEGWLVKMQLNDGSFLVESA